MDTLKNAVLWLLPGMLIGGNLQAADGRIDGQRGEMLYSTHCIACHTTEVHWRDRRLATDWQTLKGQVRRWALNSGQHWEEEDVDSVADYLNRQYYNFPAEPPPKTVSQQDSNRAGAR